MSNLTLRNVTKTTHCSINQLKEAWLNSDGRVSTGNQYSNMDSHDYCVLLTEEQYNEMKADSYGASRYLSNLRWKNKKEIQTDLATVFDVGYVAYNAPKCKTTDTKVTRKALELPDSFSGVIVHDYFTYGSSKVRTGVQIVARINGDNVTLFPTI